MIQFFFKKRRENTERRGQKSGGRRQEERERREERDLCANRMQLYQVTYSSHKQTANMNDMEDKLIVIKRERASESEEEEASHARCHGMMHF